MNIITVFRKEKEMTQKQFAEKTNLSLSSISKAEKGLLSMSVAFDICNSFPDELHINNLSIQRRTKTK